MIRLATEDRTELFEYLKEEYYSKCEEEYPDMVYTDEQIMLMLDFCEDRTIVIRNPDIQCVAIYMTLTDETYKNISVDKVMDVNSLGQMLEEKGNNFHFFLVTSKSYRGIMIAMREAKKLKPSSVSWCDPDMSQIHQYNLN